MEDQKTSARRLPGFNPFDLYTDGASPQPGEADLIVGGSTDEVIGRMAAFLWMAVRDSEGKFPFQGITVISPPQLVWDRSDTDILNLILKAVDDLRRSPADDEEVSRLRDLLSVVRCERLELAEVLNALEATGEHRLVLIPMASAYRDQNLQSQQLPLGKTGVLIAEDSWVPYVATLASRCIDLARSAGHTLVFEVPDSPPARDRNQKLLVDIDGLYPCFVASEGETDPGAILLDGVDKWVAMVVSGRLQDAMDEVNAADISPAYKSQLRVQLVDRCEDIELKAQVIKQELANGTNVPPEFAARFGRIALRAGDEQTAERLLEQGIPHVADRNLLEAVLISCTELGNPELVRRAFERLATLFPDSELLRTNRELRLMQYCQIVQRGEPQPPSRAGFNDLENYLADNLSAQGPIVYENLLDTVAQRWAGESELAVICCAIHAQARNESVAALTLGLSAAVSKHYDRQATSILLSVMRRMMLLDEISQKHLELYKQPLRQVIAYLASHPSDAHMRVALAKVLSVESCGAIGLPMIASLTLDMVKEGFQLAPETEMTAAEVEDDDAMAFFQRALSYLEKLPAVEIGVTRLPKDLVGDNPQGLVNFLTRMIHYGGNRRGEDVDLNLLEKYTWLICLLTTYAKGVGEDLDALRLLAGKYWLDGQSQRARDIAEQILEVAGDDQNRRRLAWSSFADIYQRARSPIDALVGIACSFACETEVSAADIWHEVYTLHRVVRDLGLHTIAADLIPTCHKLLEQLDLGAEARLRLQTIELGLHLSDPPENDVQALSALVADATNHCKEVIDAKGELMPAASLLAQSAGLLERAGGQLNPTTTDVLNAAFRGVGPRSAAFLRAVSAAVPSIGDVVSLHNRLEDARNSQDVTGDMVAVVMTARRLLNEAPGALVPEEAAVAIELLADRAVDSPASARKLDTAWPANYARALSKEGLAVLMLGLNNKGELASILANDGNLDARISTEGDRTFLRRLGKWSADYPYRYGFIDREDGNNEFYLSMGDLDMPIPSSPNILVIAEPVLQQIPVNLVLDAGEFAGRTRSIGYAPSLTWFEAARRSPAQHDDRRLAWISTSEDPEKVGTLEMILERLRSTFEAHHFTIDTSRQIPKNFKGAQMVVITAHGGLTTEKRFIHRISDEEMLAESPEALARALAGVEMVILFVCSGGRSDRHPLGNTTVGLPKMLLDRGCRTVIASPWPLAAVVTGPWLEEFMVAWDAGETAAAATIRANQAVYRRLGDPPQYSLAMAVHGDVLLSMRS
ncbi:CHAT domain-containing protein [Paraburkholderia dipogonis]|uniref:CHAT domain-containing protein n=1 Tax=Paraburkholderia dipogonis TaxID=1211383 RepID=A0A4Y8MX57_9BURK|nr:CHAT domain-containing protein [Paraburkholderia dipogonis]TFE42024.1 CHAT domain-containing protein [Paraburkholderia dipogonis]